MACDTLQENLMHCHCLLEGGQVLPGVRSGVCWEGGRGRGGEGKGGEGRGEEGRGWQKGEGVSEKNESPYASSSCFIFTYSSLVIASSPEGGKGEGRREGEKKKEGGREKWEERTCTHY